MPAGTFVQAIPGVVEEPVQVYVAGRADPAGTPSTVREKVPAAGDPVTIGTAVAVVISGELDNDDDGAVPEQPQRRTQAITIPGRRPRAMCMDDTSPAGQIYLTTTKGRGPAGTRARLRLYAPPGNIS
ncbi:MAG: hypothetical protein WC367_08015 [Methanoregula sp.]